MNGAFGDDAARKKYIATLEEVARLKEKNRIAAEKARGVYVPGPSNKKKK